MNKSEIIRAVRDAINNGETVIITPDTLTSVWSQQEMENIPNISVEEELSGVLYGMSVNLDGTRSRIRVFGYAD